MTKQAVKQAASLRTFTAHKRLLYDVIKRQAGTLPKAILEAAMNAIDARAASFDITMTEDKVILRDDGKGINSEAELTHVFDTFGSPHSAEEGKIYGTFRMGRGQMFSFGKNTWWTGPFVLSVDLGKYDANDTLGYKCQRAKNPVKGCIIQIELYEKITPYELSVHIRTLKAWLQFAQIPVTLNDELITADRKKLTWDHDTDEALIKLSGGNSMLQVFNLGVHVMDIPPYKYGTGGIVVTKQQVQVNFARNDIQSTCPVWSKILKLVRTETKTALAKKKTVLDANERVAIVEELLLENGYNSRQSLVVDYTGQPISGLTLRRRLNNAVKCLSVAPAKFGSEERRIADRADQRCQAVVLGNEIWRYDNTGEENPKALDRVLTVLGVHHGEYTYIPFKELPEQLSKVKWETIKPADLTEIEKTWLVIARSMIHHKRQLVIGESGGDAQGWTDGKSYIAFDRSMVNGLHFDTKGFGKLAAVLIHELTHDETNADEADHSLDFYRRFHDTCQRVIGDCIACGLAAAASVSSLTKTRAKRLAADHERQNAVLKNLLKQVDYLKKQQEAQHAGQ